MILWHDYNEYIYSDLDDALPDQHAVVGLDLELGSGADAVADCLRGHLQLQQTNSLHRQPREKSVILYRYYADAVADGLRGHLQLQRTNLLCRQPREECDTMQIL